jgi:hypothetical protein
MMSIGEVGRYFDVEIMFFNGFGVVDFTES